MKRASWLGPLWLVLLLGCAARSSSGPPESVKTTQSKLPTPLGSVEVRSNVGHAIAPRDSVTFQIESDRAERLAETLAPYGTLLEIEGRLLQIQWDYVGTPGRERPTRADIAQSFVIDYDEPSIDSVSESIVARFGPQPSAGQLSGFVSEHVATREHGRFDIASRAAAKRAGDCTEHAVLLAALARRFGMPARVVLGYVISLEHEVAIGHAWVEIYGDGAWRPYDSTRPEKPVDNLYLRQGYLADEGPGYRLGNLELIAPNRITIVEALGVDPTK